MRPGGDHPGARPPCGRRSRSRPERWSSDPCAGVGRRSPSIGPAQVQAATEKTLLVGLLLGQPEVGGVVPEIAAHRGARRRRAARARRSGRECRPGRVSCLARAAGPHAGRREPLPGARRAGSTRVARNDPGGAEHLVRLDQDPKRPFLAADVGMKGLALLAIGVADLRQRRIRRDAQNDQRVDIKAEGRQGGRPSRVRCVSTARQSTWDATDETSNGHRSDARSAGDGCRGRRSIRPAAIRPLARRLRK